MTIDYLTGIGIFLFSVVFVLQFMYSLFVPLYANSDETTLSADRTGTQIMRLLRNENSEGINVVDESKINSFIARLNYSNEDEYNNALKEVGLFSNKTVFDLNVSITYLNGSMITQAGPELPENTDVGQSRHLVLIINSSTGYNKTALMLVRVW